MNRGAHGPQRPRDENGRQRKELAGTQEAQRAREEAVRGRQPPPRRVRRRAAGARLRNDARQLAAPGAPLARSRAPPSPRSRSTACFTSSPRSPGSARTSPTWSSTSSRSRSRWKARGPSAFTSSATGPAEVTAGMIATTGDIEVTNPDLVICHLDEGATLNMELTADIGKGYQPGRRQPPGRRADRPDPGRRAVQPGPPGRLQGREHPRRAGARLRQAHADDRDRRHGHPGRRARLMPRGSSRTSCSCSSTSTTARCAWRRRR